MNREEQSKLKFDRRLRNRPGWVSQDDFDSEVEKLADAAGNVAADEEESAGADAPETADPVS